jgi:uncharacterized OB-fold protein
MQAEHGTDYAKPLPNVTPLNRPFWEGTRDRKLRMQQCLSCGHLRYPINLVCPKCLSEETEWTTLSGRGEVFSFVEYYRAYHKGFADDIPYNVALIQLEEGPRMFSNVVGIETDKIEVGMPVEVVFHTVTEEVTIPQFRPPQAPAKGGERE